MPKIRKPNDIWLLMLEAKERNVGSGLANLLMYLQYGGFALSSYDQVLFEESSVNRMQEELELFRTTSRHPSLERTNFIVLLNKWDQLEEKIRRSPFVFSFEGNEYKGDKNNPLEVVDWIRDTLQSIDEHHRLHFHVITATDTSQFDEVFGKCHEVMLREQLNRAGVL